jgi:hypothetical protein
LRGNHQKENENEEPYTPPISSNLYLTESSIPKPDDPSAPHDDTALKPDPHADTALTVAGQPPEEGNENEEEEEPVSMEDYADTVVTIMIPVTITMIIVVWAVRNINSDLEGGSSGRYVPRSFALSPSLFFLLPYFSPLLSHVNKNSLAA